MTERPDPLALILARGLREIAERRAREDAERRRTMHLVDGKQRRNVA